MEERFGVRFHYEGGYTFDCTVSDEAESEQFCNSVTSCATDPMVASITVTPINMPICTVVKLKGCTKIERIKVAVDVVVTEVLWEIGPVEDAEVVEVTLGER